MVAYSPCPQYTSNPTACEVRVGGGSVRSVLYFVTLCMTALKMPAQPKENNQEKEGALTVA